jgi:hypothetical protein
MSRRDIRLTDFEEDVACLVSSLDYVVLVAQGVWRKPIGFAVERVGFAPQELELFVDDGPGPHSKNVVSTPRGIECVNVGVRCAGEGFTAGGRIASCPSRHASQPPTTLSRPRSAPPTRSSLADGVGDGALLESTPRRGQLHLVVEFVTCSSTYLRDLPNQIGEFVSPIAVLTSQRNQLPRLDHDRAALGGEPGYRHAAAPVPPPSNPGSCCGNQGTPPRPAGQRPAGLFFAPRRHSLRAFRGPRS